MRKVAILGLCLAALSANPCHAEYRTWSNAEGMKIEAEFVKSEGDHITLRLRNGKLSTFPLSKLSEADQEFIQKVPSEGKEKPEQEPKVDSGRKAKWLNKMDKAQEEAKETGLPILVLFTGTSWCPYCMRLEKEVFAEKEFKDFANQNLVLLMLDFGPGGKGKSKDEAMAKEFGVTGFPTYFLTDASGAKLAQGGYHQGINPQSFAEWVKRSAPKK